MMRDREPYISEADVSSTLMFCVAASLTVAGCDPVVDIEGSFFPAWMLCLIAGVVLAAIARLAFARLGIEPYLGPLPLIYSCLAVLLAMTTWLIFFHT